jgi:hypothetical protein
MVVEYVSSKIMTVIAIRYLHKEAENSAVRNSKFLIHQ